MTDVLITGGGGMLAYALKQEFARRGYRFEAPTRSQLDVTDEPQVHEWARRLEPRVIIHCAAYTRVDDAESHEEEAYRVNALGTKFAAEAACHVGARFVFPSTDYVFDGTATTPYKPDDEPNPINAYGRTKLAGEEAARLAGDCLIVRLSWLYGRGGKNFVHTIGERLTNGEIVRVVTDQFGSPTWTSDAARALIDMIEVSAARGTYHWANQGVASWFDVALEVARALECPDRVQPITTAALDRAASRPAFSALDSHDSEGLIGAARDWRIALAQAMRLQPAK